MSDMYERKVDIRTSMFSATGKFMNANIFTPYMKNPKILVFKYFINQCLRFHIPLNSFKCHFYKPTYETQLKQSLFKKGNLFADTIYEPCYNFSFPLLGGGAFLFFRIPLQHNMPHVRYTSPLCDI